MGCAIIERSEKVWTDMGRSDAKTGICAVKARVEAVDGGVLDESHDGMSRIIRASPPQVFQLSTVTLINQVKSYLAANKSAYRTRANTAIAKYRVHQQPCERSLVELARTLHRAASHQALAPKHLFVDKVVPDR